MTKNIVAIIIIISFTAISCGKRKEEVKAKHEVVKPEVIKKDTVKLEPPVIEEPEPVVVEVPDNKYFLIAGSFASMENAETFKNELIQQGYDAEVIVRKIGKNKEFYKVSYKGFSNKDDAFNELAMERKLPNNQEVWLLIKQ